MKTILCLSLFALSNALFFGNAPSKPGGDIAFGGESGVNLDILDTLLPGILPEGASSFSTKDKVGVDLTNPGVETDKGGCFFGICTGEKTRAGSLGGSNLGVANEKVVDLGLLRGLGLPDASVKSGSSTGYDIGTGNFETKEETGVGGLFSVSKSSGVDLPGLGDWGGLFGGFGKKRRKRSLKHILMPQL